jgi:hypothetical protein
MPDAFVSLEKEFSPKRLDPSPTQSSSVPSRMRRSIQKPCTKAPKDCPQGLCEVGLTKLSRQKRSRERPERLRIQLLYKTTPPP